jgi:hypothetical protein
MMNGQYQQEQPKTGTIQFWTAFSVIQLSFLVSLITKVLYDAVKAFSYLHYFEIPTCELHVSELLELFQEVAEHL